MSIIPEIARSRDEIQSIRRDIHAHPELCYEEARTAELVAQKLESWDIEVTRGLGKTGVVGVLKKGASNRRASSRSTSPSARWMK